MLHYVRIVQSQDSQDRLLDHIFIVVKATEQCSKERILLGALARINKVRQAVLLRHLEIGKDFQRKAFRIARMIREVVDVDMYFTESLWDG
jgi:hypothetical protein